MPRLKALLPWALGAVAVVVAAVLLAAWQTALYLHRPLALPEEGTVLDVRPGSSFGRIAGDLAGRGYLDHPQLLRIYARLSGSAERVKAGEYALEPGVTPASLLAMLVAGDVKLYSFTIVEGWSFRELMDALSAHPAVESTLAYEDWQSLLARLDAPYEHPEGLFLPETYRFPRYTPDVDILEQAYELMETTLSRAWAERDQGLPLEEPYDALILASIIEKETALAGERPRIAGVFVRRLERGMRLQTDPTVIYGVGETFDGNLTRRHLRTDTPYNTYTRRGLPPTPIAMPGKAAIEAAVHPEEGEEVYFVATGLGDGSHKFSVTREEHEAAVREYLARQRQNRGKPSQ